MDFPIHKNAIRMGLSIIYLKGISLFLVLKIALTTAKSVDPDEMLPYTAFHLGLHCLPKYMFRGFQNTKG